MAVFGVLELAACTALVVDDEPGEPARYACAYRVRGGYRWLLGHAVIDEFGTFSSPILVGPAPLLGRIYGLGIALGHRRDPEMGIDTGWPPLCAGIEEPAPELGEAWEERMLERLGGDETATGERPEAVESWRDGVWETSRWRRREVVVLATTAPLLPRQLGLLCEEIDAPLAIAFSTGNRIVRRPDARPQSIRVVSEDRLPSVEPPTS